MEDNSDFDITDIIVHCLSDFISTVFLFQFENSLRNSFGDISNLNNKLSKDPLEIIIKFEDYNIRITEKNDKLVAECDAKGKRYICRKMWCYQRPHQDGENTIICYMEKKQFLDEFQVCINSLFRKGTVSILSKINNVYYLPASILLAYHLFLPIKGGYKTIPLAS